MYTCNHFHFLLRISTGVISSLPDACKYLMHSITLTTCSLLLTICSYTLPPPSTLSHNSAIHYYFSNFVRQFPGNIKLIIYCISFRNIKNPSIMILNILHCYSFSSVSLSLNLSDHISNFTLYSMFLSTILTIYRNFFLFSMVPVTPVGFLMEALDSRPQSISSTGLYITFFFFIVMSRFFVERL